MLGRRSLLIVGVVTLVWLHANAALAASYRILRSGGAPLEGAALSSSTNVTLDYTGMPKPRSVKWILRNANGTIIAQTGRDAFAPFVYSISRRPDGRYSLTAVLRFSLTTKKVRATFTFGPPEPPHYGTAEYGNAEY